MALPFWPYPGACPDGMPGHGSWIPFLAESVKIPWLIPGEGLARQCGSRLSFVDGSAIMERPGPRGHRGGHQVFLLQGEAAATAGTLTQVSLGLFSSHLTLSHSEQRSSCFLKG